MSNHLNMAPSPWICRFAALAPAGAAVLDVAAGTGRHGRLFLDRDHPVTFVDKAIGNLDDLMSDPHASVVEMDLEDGRPWPFPEAAFGVVIVSNYLYRPHLGDLPSSLIPGGVLIYETFGEGNAAYGKPANPDFLLAPGELLEVFANTLSIVAYEHGQETQSGEARVRSRICAVKSPPPHSLPSL